MLKALILVVLAVSALASEDPNPRLHRPNLLVADIEKALTIYRDILGFKAHQIVPSGPDSYSYAIYDLPKTATLRFMFLSTADQQWTLALTEAKGVTLPATRRPYENAVIIEIKGDLDATLAKLRAAGVAVDTPAPLTSPTGQKRVDVAFTDFDGHRVVLFKTE